MNRHKLGIAVLAILALAALLIGCQLQPSGDTGSIYLNLGFAGARSFLPPISMEAASYRVVGDGPGSATFDIVVTSSGVIPNLVPGDWTLIVYGRNDTDYVLGEGTGAVTVVIGATATCNITVAEYTGPGALASHVTWEPDIIDSPLLTASIKNFGGTEWTVPYSLDLVACTGDASVSDLPAGWYAMVAELFEQGTSGNVRASGFATAVRIAQGQTTQVGVDMHAVAGTGSIELLLDLDFFDPLELTGIPATSQPPAAPTVVTLYNGSSSTISVSSPDAFTAVWYINGQVAGTGSSYTVEADDLLEGEFYRLDVIAFSIDGKHANSLTWRLDRMGIDATTLNITGTINLRTDQGVPPWTGQKNLIVQLYDASVNVIDTLNLGLVEAGIDLSKTYAFASGGPYAGGSYWLATFVDLNGNGIADDPGAAFGWFGTNNTTRPATRNVSVPHASGEVFNLKPGGTM